MFLWLRNTNLERRNLTFEYLETTESAQQSQNFDALKAFMVVTSRKLNLNKNTLVASFQLNFAAICTKGSVFLYSEKVISRLGA